VRVVQVLGTNGAGKSTLLRTLAKSDPRVWSPEGYTILPSWRFILVGEYMREVNTPGADTFRNKAELLDFLTRAAQWVTERKEPWVVAWEGIIIMTRQYHEEYLRLGLSPLYLMLDTSLEECYRRIEVRSGKKQEDLKGNGEIVENRLGGVKRLADWLSAQGAEVVRINGEAPIADNVRRLIRAAWRVPSGTTAS
jgi:thymidylate kinase